MKTHNPFRYSLYAQNRDETVIIKNNVQNNFAVQYAANILATPELIDNFSEKDKTILEAIASVNSV